MSQITVSQFEPDCPENGIMDRRGVFGSIGRKLTSIICLPAVWIPFVVLVALTAVLRITDADMALVRPFYAGGAAGSEVVHRWPLAAVYPWKALYDWGIYPAWILGCGGLVVWIASFLWLKLEPWRDAGLFFCLVLLVGPGMLVNGVLKPCWGRPRPNNVIPFGGEREFLPVLEWGRGQDESSFPSGHASTGFYLMTPAFVCYRRHRRRALAFLLLGLSAGCIIGLARIVAGGHFPSDVLWAGGVVYFTALVLAAPFRFGDEIPPIWKR